VPQFGDLAGDKNVRISDRWASPFHSEGVEAGGQDDPSGVRLTLKETSRGDLRDSFSSGGISEQIAINVLGCEFSHKTSFLSPLCSNAYHVGRCCPLFLLSWKANCFNGALSGDTDWLPGNIPSPDVATVPVMPGLWRETTYRVFGNHLS
jgi:hypothetical protein